MIFLEGIGLSILIYATIEVVQGIEIYDLPTINDLNYCIGAWFRTIWEFKMGAEQCPCFEVFPS